MTMPKSSGSIVFMKVREEPEPRSGDSRGCECCVDAKSSLSFLGIEGGAQAHCCGFLGADLHLRCVFLKSLVLTKVFCMWGYLLQKLNTFIYGCSSSSKHITSDFPFSVFDPQNKMVSSAGSILTTRDLPRN